MEFIVPEVKIHNVKHKLDILARRAVKLGFKPLSYEVGEKFFVRGRYDKYGNFTEGALGKNAQARVKINVEGERPIIDGYRFLAKLELSDDGNLIVGFAGAEDVDHCFRNTDKRRCDHCNVKHARKYAFVIENIETGEQIQVGKSCLSDFFGRPVEQVVAYASVIERIEEIFEDDDDGFSVGGGGLVYHDGLDILEASAFAIRNWGFVRAGDGGLEDGYGGIKQSTADAVRALVGKDHGTLSKNLTDADRDVARKALEWIRGDDVDTSSNYIYSLRLILSGENPWVEDNKVNLVVSLVQSYLRHSVKKVQREASTSDYYGVVGKRYKGIAATVNRVIDCGENAYGPVVLIGFLGTDGNEFSWFTNSTRNLVVGDSVSLTGTVKKHNEYRGVKQTILTRCKVVDA